MLNRTREAYRQMQRDPGVSYRCGTFALAQMARWRAGGVFDSTALLSIPSPAVGFSMAQLVGFSDKLQLHLAAVARIKGAELVVPSVIHWGQGHYAAIVGTEGQFYRVVDPTFGYPRYLTAEAINAEASGFFLVPDNLIPAGYVRMTTSEASGILGRGNYNIFADHDDQTCTSSCPSCPPGSSGGGGPGGPGGPGSPGGPSGGPLETSSGGGPNPLWGGDDKSASGGNALWGSGDKSATGGCQSCSGMPVWGVSEPYLNLWLHDEPLGYQPAQGPRLSLHLAYKQRDEAAGGDPYTTGFGAGWNSAFLSQISSPGTYQYHTLMPADVSLPGGGISHFDFSGGLTQATNYYNNLVLHPVLNGTGDVVSYELIYPSGAKDVYDFFRADPGTGWSSVFMTKRIDTNGRMVQYTYFQLPTSFAAQEEAQVDVVEFRQAAPYDHVPRRRIRGSVEIAAESGDFYYVI